MFWHFIFFFPVINDHIFPLRIIQERNSFRMEKGAAVSAVFQPGRIEGTEIIRRLLQHPECQGQVD